MFNTESVHLHTSGSLSKIEYTDSRPDIKFHDRDYVGVLKVSEASK